VCILLGCLTNLREVGYGFLHASFVKLGLCIIPRVQQREFPFRSGRLCLKCDGTLAETRFCLSAKWTSPFKSAGASVQSTTGSRGLRISGSNAGYTKFRGSVRVLAPHSIRQFPLHFFSRASQCAITFQLDSTINNTTTKLILNINISSLPRNDRGKRIKT